MKTLLLFSILILAATFAQADTCSTIYVMLDNAETNLTRASEENSLDVATNYARQSQEHLDNAAMAAVRCECPMASMEFDTAASNAKRASEASDSSDFINYLDKSIDSYNKGIDILDICPATR